MYQAFAAQLVVLLCTNHFMAVFFVLPSMPTRRTQRLMTVYIIILGEFAILILFYGQQQGGMALLWALLIDSAAVVILKTVSVQLFLKATIPKTELYQDRAKVLQQRNSRRRARRQAEVPHGSEAAWDLMLRQTVPRGSAAAAACAPGEGDGGFAFTEPEAAQYYDALRMHALPPSYYGP
jgi:hypothetical protein